MMKVFAFCIFHFKKYKEKCYFLVEQLCENRILCNRRGGGGGGGGRPLIRPESEERHSEVKTAFEQWWGKIPKRNSLFLPLPHSAEGRKKGVWDGPDWRVLWWALSLSRFSIPPPSFFPHCWLPEELGMRGLNLEGEWEEEEEEA